MRAHVDDQHQRQRRHALAPVALVTDQPGVERRLRLLEQHHVGKTRGARRLDGQLARHLVE